jgi:hypothetical protein
MKKQSKRPQDASEQLRFELTCSPAQSDCEPQNSAPYAAHPDPVASIVSLTSARRQRELERERALLDAVRTRAAHLTDCLFKR